MGTVTLKEAQIRLRELLRGLCPGEAITIVDHDVPIARITSTEPRRTPTAERTLGFLAGSVTYMAPDFDAPLDAMKDYMP